MYYCKDCEYEFLSAESRTERHRLDCEPFEKIWVCPRCKSSNIEKVRVKHCKYCGRRLADNKREYCNGYCKEKGQFLWEQQAKRKRKYEKSSLVGIVREIEKYNQTHKTKITYGKYVALIGGR